jgi:quinolinate synthase
MIQMKEMQEKILKLKKEKDFCILAHTYESHDILEIADFTGDSFALSRKATGVSEKNVLMCGVRFMAETVKLLSPEKRVLIASPDAGCPMAEQFTRQDVEAWRAEHPDAIVVAYVNTTTDIKRACDYCVTSASAVKIVSQLPDDKEILFIPDRNLGSYVSKKLPSKRLVFWNGGCPVHNAITPQELADAKARHPEALVLTHPECVKEVADASDFVGSTTAIMDFAAKSDASSFIIGTENNIVTHLQYELPSKTFYPLSKRLICSDMRLTQLPDVLAALEGVGGLEIELDADTLREARVCIDRMIEMG